MAAVFISYRREDSPGHAGRVFDRLRARLGSDSVFMDVAGVDAGVDFVEALDHAVGSCDALLAIIGPDWISAVNGNGRRRLDDPRDFVRFEIGAALRRGVRVVPVLVNRAHLPTRDELPAELQELTRRNAVELRDTRWDADVDQLVTSIENLLTATDPDHSGREQHVHRVPSVGWGLRALGGAVAIIVLVSVGATIGARACTPPPFAGTRATPVAPAVGADPDRSTKSSANTSDTGDTTADARARLRVDAFGLWLDTITDTPPGVIVGRVEPGGPADTAGIAVDDVLVTIAGRSVTSFSTVAGAVSHHLKSTPPGTAATVDIVREGKGHKLPVLFDRSFTQLTFPR